MAETKQKQKGAGLIKNAKHEHFCQLVSNGESAPKAYVLAGYSENGAEQSTSRLLKIADICDRIAYLRSVKEQHHAEAVKEAIHKSGVGKQWILEKLKEVVEIGMAVEPVKDKEGNNTGDYKATNLAAANKALELLGSEEGLFIKRIETGDPGEFYRLNDDELNDRLNKADEALRLANAAIGSAAASSRNATKAKQAKN